MLTRLCWVTVQYTVQNGTLRVNGGTGEEGTGPNWDISGQTKTRRQRMSFARSVNLSLLKVKAVS